MSLFEYVYDPGKTLTNISFMNLFSGLLSDNKL